MADEDVRWIITSEEESAFKKLSNDAERDTFIEGFWLRRDPTPDTAENEYKEEHYRRIAYANEHFAAGMPGWRTDRGRIYIMFGPPDSIDAHPWEALTSVPRKKAVGAQRHSRLKSGAIVIWKRWASRKWKSNLWMIAVVALMK